MQRQSTQRLSKTLPNFFPADAAKQSPLHCVLKRYALQQYSQKLCEKGFGNDLSLLARLSDEQLTELLDQVKALPGHRARFQQAIAFLQTLQCRGETEDRENLAQRPLRQAKWEF